MLTVSHFFPPQGLPNTESLAGIVQLCLPRHIFSTTSVVNSNGFAMSLLQFLSLLVALSNDAQSHGCFVPSQFKDEGHL